MKRAHRQRIIGPLLLIALIAALAATCSEGPRRALSGNGAVLWRLGETASPPVANVKGREGDLVLMSASVALVVASEDDGPRRAHRAGSIVAATTAAAEGGELEELRPIVRVGRSEVELEVVKVRALKREGVPFIEVRARNEDAGIESSTRIALDPVSPVAHIETTVKNTGRTAASYLQLGDRVAWPDGLTFAPGEGFVAAASSVEAKWLGRRGVDASYALAFPKETPTTSFEFEPHGPMGASTFTAPGPLPPGASRTYRRSLIVVKGGLERAAREAWSACGAKLAHIRGTLSPAPAWASIEVVDRTFRPVIIGDAALDGAFEVWVPEGRFEVVARAPGGEDRVTVDAPAEEITEVALTPPTPGVLSFHVADTAGRPIASRLVLRGVRPTPDPRLGPRYQAQGADNVVYTASGDGAVELPRGTYLVTAVHGVEHSIASQEILVSEGKGAVFRAALAREFETPGWIAADFHLHAEPSFDSSVSLEDRVTSLLTEDLDFAAATDHNAVTDYGEALAALGASEHLGFARGVEVTTEDPKLGHFNVWPYPADAPIPPFAGQTPRALFAAIREAAPDAVLQVNHPRMGKYGIDYFGIVGLDPKTGATSAPDSSMDFDAVELWNGMDNNDMETTRRNLGEWFDLLNAGYRYTATGGSDSHVLIYQWAGFPRNYVRVGGADHEAVSAGAVAAAVREGRVQVGAGPFIELSVAGGKPGDLVRAAPGRIPIEVEVRAASWVDVDSIEIWMNGELVAEGGLATGAAGSTRGRMNLRVLVERDAFIVAVARGDRPMTEVLPYTKLAPFAFTNPVFVDVDGNGVFTPLHAAEGLGGGAVDAGATAPFEGDAGHAF